ncbi:uncharacterized GPI-anchored protein At4g28100-like, partial [Actinidia eriantha]|uniref:uncharacterized GPI-anchored protein At4g28100-like n=1 Tax=Actinidia eriantha TaxID=165200 RepID=UPI002583C2E0
LPTLPALPDLDLDPAPIQPFLPNPSPPAFISAFSEQSDAAGCPLNRLDKLFYDVKSAVERSGQLHRSRCCPVLVAWLFSAYSGTTLSRACRTPETASYDLPLLPDDSETCVDSLQKALNNRGIELVKPNETCDVVYCYCGIRLHPLSCPERFMVSKNGKLVGDESVRRLERDCLSNSVNGAYAGLGGCSKCLNSLYLLLFFINDLDYEPTGGTLGCELENRVYKRSLDGFKGIEYGGELLPSPSGVSILKLP